MDREEGVCDKIEEFCDYATKVKVNRKRFLKSLLILGSSFIILGKAENAYAHPPSDIKITYDSQSKILNAVIIHQVSNPQTHYINKVDIYLNGREIIEHKISRQDNNTEQAVTYLIPDVKAGDRLAVEAYCNISGKLEREIIT
jgi:desulfoferrodoxin (superoxide reductase-like protein)